MEEHYPGEKGLRKKLTKYAVIFACTYPGIVIASSVAAYDIYRHFRKKKEEPIPNLRDGKNDLEAMVVEE